MVGHVQITKEDVDTYEAGQEIPCCHLTAVWTKQGEQPSKLSQKVTLIGATAANNYFSIVLNSTPPDTTGGELLTQTVSFVVTLNYFTISVLDKYMYILIHECTGLKTLVMLSLAQHFIFCEVGHSMGALCF